MRVSDEECSKEENQQAQRPGLGAQQGSSRGAGAGAATAGKISDVIYHFNKITLTTIFR